MTCFDEAGVKVPKCADGVPARCKCGALVRFDIAARRAEHFLACPVVYAKIMAAQAPLAAKAAQIDPALIAQGYALAQRLGLA